MAYDGNNVLMRADQKLSGYLAICSDPDLVYGRGKQEMRMIVRGTKPSNWLVWILIWILATRDAKLHERLVNMFLGCAVGMLVCAIVKLIVKRPRPPIPGASPGYGLGKYSFPSGHAMVITLACYFVTTSYNGDSVVFIVMKTASLVICLVMVMLGRQYILDILGGIVVGILVYQLLIRFLWISANTCEPYIKSVQAALHFY